MFKKSAKSEMVTGRLVDYLKKTALKYDILDIQQVIVNLRESGKKVQFSRRCRVNFTGKPIDV
jgi:hypothetical protein